DAEPDDLGVALFELRLQPSHVSEFGGAYRSEILGMGKQNGPAIANPLMEVDRPFRSLCREVRSLGVDTQGHAWSPLLQTGHWQDCCRTPVLVMQSDQWPQVGIVRTALQWLPRRVHLRNSKESAGG